MIDTDKYEGHTEGPWRVVKHTGEWDDEPPVEGVVLIASPLPSPLTVAVCDNRWQMDGNGLDLHMQHSTTGATAREMFNANQQLIADAPLLLAEVKRLRRVLEDIESMIPDNHEEVSPILSDILSECHRVLPMFSEVIE
jgi:hypothetical protein|tara:strand:- start:2863 stop:3279 length:417 start_codon:yes stop_codon:yes gene_type:complete